ncbi:MAG: LysM peptidoglycan-binding domain-containing protein [Chloroflexi bacterium]|nr:LysM peptidoglycan-binding domain-containing protein [Chloroflexota bacterium]
MNTPNPLIPQGTLQQPLSRGKSNVRIAVFTIIAIHAVFFGGLLMQGCKREVPKTTAAQTNKLTLPPLDTNYYTNLPPEAVTAQPVTPAPAAQLPVAAAPTPAALPTEAPAETKEYIVAKGDSFYKIAKDHGVSVAAITKANPGVDSTKLQVGSKLQIPLAATPAPAAIGASEGSYVVVSGDTLTKIAKLHGTTVKEIRAANNLRTDRLLVGQKLNLPAAKAAAPSVPAGVPSPQATNLTPSPR